MILMSLIAILPFITIILSSHKENSLHIYLLLQAVLRGLHAQVWIVFRFLCFWFYSSQAGIVLQQFGVYIYRYGAIRCNEKLLFWKRDSVLMAFVMENLLKKISHVFSFHSPAFCIWFRGCLWLLWVVTCQSENGERDILMT